MLRARYVLVLALVGCTSPAGEPESSVAASEVQSAAAGIPLRVMSANTTSGNYQSYDPGDGTRMFQGLKPDVVLVQEFNIGTNTEADVRSYIDTTFGPSFAFYRESAQLPNGIVSRYPITDSGSWKDPRTGTRGFAWAKIAVPGQHALWAVSLHLLTSSSGNRRDEAAEIVARVRAVVPETDYLVIGGDFNTTSRGEACIQTLGAVVKAGAPYPDDGRNGNTSAARSKPLDWVLPDGDLAALQVPTRIGGAEFPAGLVFDSRVFASLADVAPVRASDSAATNMQHMPVIKDFVLPN